MNQYRKIFGRTFTLSLALLVSSPSWTQEPEEVLEEIEEGEDVLELSGDKIYLKSGRIMTGVQVLRLKAGQYEVQIVEGVEPLYLPAKHVKDIDYDDIDPVRDARRRKNKPEDDQTLISGIQVSPELNEKLNKPISDQPLVYKNTDVTRILRQLTNQTKIAYVIDPSVKAIDPAKRQWTITVKHGDNLMKVLPQLHKKFPELEVQIQFNELRIITKKAAKLEAETTTETPAAEKAVTPTLDAPLGNK